jgi:hypothetical protein
MTKEQAIEILQNFLDKSSHHKWKKVQEAIDYLNDKPTKQPRWKPQYNLTDKEIVELWIEMESPLNRPEFERHLVAIQDKLRDKNL